MLHLFWHIGRYFYQSEANIILIICKVKKCVKEWGKTKEGILKEGYPKIITVQSGIRIIPYNTDFSDVIGKSIQMCFNIHFSKGTQIIITL